MYKVLLLILYIADISKLRRLIYAIAS